MTMQAVVLAAGAGRKLEPITSTRQKGMIHLCGKPILYHVLSAIKHAGIKDIIFVVKEFSEEIISYFGNGDSYDVNIKYITQKEGYGTATALLSAYDNIKDNFLIISSDVIFEHSIMEKIPEYDRKNLVIGAKVENPTDYGVIETKSSKRQVKAIIEKPKKARKNSIINTGIFLFEASMIDKFKKISDKYGYKDLPNVINKAIQEELDLSVLKLNGVFHDIGHPWELLAANEFVVRKIKHKIAGVIEPGVIIKGDVVIEEGSVITGNSYIKGPVYIGKNCEIGPNCFIRDNVSIGDNVRIGRSVEVKNSIILNNTKAEHLAYIGDSIIGSNCNFGAGTKIANLRFDDDHVRVKIGKKKVSSGRRKLGAIIGDNTKTGVNACFMPGVKAGPYSIIGAGVILNEDAPPHTKIILKQQYQIEKLTTTRKNKT